MLLDHFFDELFCNAISILTVVKIVLVGNCVGKYDRKWSLTRSKDYSKIHTAIFLSPATMAKFALLMHK